MESWSTYPYTSINGGTPAKCKYNKADAVVTVTGG